MALQLIAQQLCLSNLFTGREQYIIPPYQRPYSWGVDQCQQLYDDIVAAYNDNSDYFLGNIVLAVSEKETGGKKPRVVDGQQRLTTIWLMFKAFSALFPNMKVLQDVLCTYNWDGSASEKKIRSDVLESNDDKTLKEIYLWDFQNNNTPLKEVISSCQAEDSFRGKDHHKTNFLFFLQRFVDFKEAYGQENLTKFLKFTLQRVTLLPIELPGETVAKAEGKALTIFETINNRGMNLQDADIFKAKLYNKANSADNKKDFMRRWQALKESCSLRKKSIDDLFRYYSHIERGLAGITRNEISLRDFFTAPDSVLNRKGYDDIMNDLERINMVLDRYDMEAQQPTALAKWLQIINIYTNAFPKYAAVAFLFRNGFDKTEEVIRAMKTIVRYSYSMGSTTYVKYGIYNIIRQVMNDQQIEIVPRDVNEFTLSFSMGKLKWGYALLAAYIEKPTAWPHYCYDHLLSTRDIQNMSKYWKANGIDFDPDCLGNLLVAGCPKYSPNYSEKRDYYKLYCGDELKEFFNNTSDIVYIDEIYQRDALLAKRILNFIHEKDS